MTSFAADSLSNSGAPSFGALLKSWRGTRKRSQLDLALDAGVSQRHLSFLESGRAQPSRDMILQLAEVLDIPLRERNMLLHAAGFASLYQERGLDSAEMAAIKQALEMMLRHHDPYPAVVVDRHWNLVLRNAAADRFIGLLGDQETIWGKVDPSGQYNILRMTFHPSGMQPLLRNWEPTATLLLSRLQREVTADPANGRLRDLFNELSALPCVPPNWRNQVWNSVPPPFLPLEVGMGDLTLKLFSMISTFGTALDVTAEELRVEAFFPADDFSAQFFKSLAQASPAS
ncbi:MAG TPA: helix-turn-helix transcriptional regulator [Dongiaceae bacterium]|nr:helix-turn-helix transcriptional regulator [Dongiaceae bacterium]